MRAGGTIALNTRELTEFYRQYFGYFNTLDGEHQTLFSKRCHRFLNDKEIIGAGDEALDNRVKALIAASAVQLTLGLEHWSLDYFDIIVIHPGDFSSPSSGLKFRGETNTGGYIRLSWKSFLRGYRINDDNINLGLHEFSHALKLNGFRGNRQDYFMEYYFNSWMASAYEAFYDIRNKKETVFRSYGGTNMSEFLCVCIEHFFESPESILERYPLLYYSTAALLNQRTVKGRTSVNIRPEVLLLKNELLPGFQPRSLHSPLADPRLIAFIIVFLVYVYTSVATGIFSGLSFLLLLLCLALYAAYDYRYLTVKLENRAFSLRKGLLLFRFRRKKVLPLTHLVSITGLKPDESGPLEMIYYDPLSGYFYVETLGRPDAGAALAFRTELKINRVALI